MKSTRLIVCVGLSLRIVIALLTPTFFAPDERDHFRYIQYLYENKTFPIQRLDVPYSNLEHWQSPGYYLCLAPFYALVNSFGLAEGYVVRAIRLTSIGLWCVFLGLSKRFLDRAAIDDPFIRTFVLALVSLLPTLICASATINNDNLMLVIAAAILCATVSPLQSIRQAVVVGLLFGMGMLVKLTVVITMPFMMVITLLSAAGADRKQRYRAALYVFVALAIAFASYLPWLIRNFDLYGHPTGENVSAVRFHWQSMWQAVYESLRDMTETFFAAAGPWNNITAAPFVTVGQQLLWFSGAGLVVYCFSQTRNPAQTSAGRRQFNILCLASATAVGVAVLLLVRFGIYFGQSSGRYLYPLLFPIAVLLSVGLRVYSLPNGRAAIALGFVTYAICFVSYVLGNYLWDEENVSKLLRTLDPPA